MHKHNMIAHVIQVSILCRDMSVQPRVLGRILITHFALLLPSHTSSSESDEDRPALAKRRQETSVTTELPTKFSKTTLILPAFRRRMMRSDPLQMGTKPPKTCLTHVSDYWYDSA